MKIKINQPEIRRYRVTYLQTTDPENGISEWRKGAVRNDFVEIKLIAAQLVTVFENITVASVADRFVNNEIIYEVWRDED